MNFIGLEIWNLGLAALLVLINASLSIFLQLGLARRLLIAATRMVIQLTLVGLVLTMLSKDMRYMVGFGVCSVAVLVWVRPRREGFEEQLTRLRRLGG